MDRERTLHQTHSRAAHRSYSQLRGTKTASSKSSRCFASQKTCQFQITAGRNSSPVSFSGAITTSGDKDCFKRSQDASQFFASRASHNFGEQKLLQTSLKMLRHLRGLVNFRSRLARERKKLRGEQQLLRATSLGTSSGNTLHLSPLLYSSQSSQHQKNILTIMNIF